MSLYNMVHGVDPSAIFIVPLFGTNPNDLPNFRDSKVYRDTDGVFKLAMLARNRMRPDEWEAYKRLPGFIEKFECDLQGESHKEINLFGVYEDESYTIHLFEIPDEWKNEFQNILQKKFSLKYKNQLLKILREGTQAYEYIKTMPTI